MRVLSRLMEVDELIAGFGSAGSGADGRRRVRQAAGKTPDCFLNLH